MIEDYPGGAAPSMIVTFPGVVSADFFEWFWGFISKSLPLRYGKDALYVSADVVRHIPDELRRATYVDVRLRGYEMRLERRA